MKRGRTATGAAVICLWLGLVLAGMTLLNGKSNIPGSLSSAPLKWPAPSRLLRNDGHPTIVLFAHPHCPCTRATLGELELVLARYPGRLQTIVVFVSPADTKSEWSETALTRRASEIPGVKVHFDYGGAEARLFNSQTSGQVLAYGKDSSLIFEGGITSARGHSGDNPGRSMLESILDGKLSGPTTNSVFGCPLLNSVSGGGPSKTTL